METMKRLKKYFNVPIIIYIILFFVCGVMIFPNAIDSTIPFSALFANIGYSLLASNIAGILFDLGNNISICRKSQKQYDAITFSHSNLLNDIIAVVDDICEDLHIEDNDCVTFEQQLRIILFEGHSERSITEKDYLESTNEILYWLELMKNESEKLLNISYIMYENDNFTEKKRRHIRFLTAMSKEAILQFEKHTIDSHKKVYDLIYNKIFRQMFILYPDQKSLFDDETMRK